MARSPSRKKTPQAIHREAKKRQKRMINDFTPPEGVVLPFRVASLGSRFSAQFLDILITSLFVLALVIVLAVIGFDGSTFLITIGSLLFFFMRAPYYIATELIWNGQTLGKRITKMRVVSADGRSLRPYAVTVRNLMKEMEIFVPGTMLFVLPELGFLEAILLLIWIAILLAVPLMNRRRQRLGDMIAGTYVVELPRAALLPDMATKDQQKTKEKFSFLAHQLDHYGAFELQTLEKVLRTDATKLYGEAWKRHQNTLLEITERVRAKIEYTQPVVREESEPFLRAFYRAQRQYLETRPLFGDAREDKFHREDEGDQKK
ncbi:MAG: RDD family protein [Pseudomonadota bacterium]